MITGVYTAVNKNAASGGAAAGLVHDNFPCVELSDNSASVDWTSRLDVIAQCHKIMDIRVGRLASLPDFVRWLGRLLQTQINDVNPSSRLGGQAFQEQLFI